MNSALGVVSTLALGLMLGPVSSYAHAASPSGFRAYYVRDLDGLEKKLTSLAEAFPAEKYSWRPGDGVRSVSEVFVHVAGGNFMMPSAAGIKPPEGISRGMEKTVTDKAEVIKVLKDSLQHLRQAVTNTSDEDLDKPIKVFGRESTIQGLFYLIATHVHEHLGQSIAYARINGVVPPWSQK